MFIVPRFFCGRRGDSGNRGHRDGVSLAQSHARDQNKPYREAEFHFDGEEEPHNALQVSERLFQ